MPAVVIEIADAVVAAMNAKSDAGELSERFAAERLYVPIHRAEELTDLRVSVVPRELSMVILTRGSDDFTYTIDVAVQKKIGQGKMTPAEIKAACDPLMLLSEEIADLFRGREFLASIPGRFVGLTNSPIFVPDHLDEHRVFTGVVSPQFRAARAK